MFPERTYEVTASLGTMTCEVSARNVSDAISAAKAEWNASDRDLLEAAAFWVTELRTELRTTAPADETT